MDKNSINNLILIVKIHILSYLLMYIYVITYNISYFFDCWVNFLNKVPENPVNMISRNIEEIHDKSNLSQTAARSHELKSGRVVVYWKWYMAK